MWINSISAWNFKRKLPSQPLEWKFIIRPPQKKVVLDSLFYLRKCFNSEFCSSNHMCWGLILENFQWWNLKPRPTSTHPIEYHISPCPKATKFDKTSLIRKMLWFLHIQCSKERELYSGSPQRQNLDQKSQFKATNWSSFQGRYYTKEEI